MPEHRHDSPAAIWLIKHLAAAASCLLNEMPCLTQTGGLPYPWRRATPGCKAFHSTAQLHGSCQPKHGRQDLDNKHIMLRTFTRLHSSPHSSYAGQRCTTPTCKHIWLPLLHALAGVLHQALAVLSRIDALHLPHVHTVCHAKTRNARPAAKDHSSGLEH